MVMQTYLYYLASAVEFLLKNEPLQGYNIANIYRVQRYKQEEQKTDPQGSFCQDASQAEGIKCGNGTLNYSKVSYKNFNSAIEVILLYYF